MAYCRNCGKELADDDKFCPHCGAPCEGEAAPRLSDGGVDYRELKLAASLVNAKKKKNLAFSFAIICAVLYLIFLLTNFIAVISLISSKIFYFGFLIDGTLFVFILIIVCLPKLIKSFTYSEHKNLCEASTLGDLRKMQETDTFCLEILIGSFISLTLHFIIGASGFSFFSDISQFKLMFCEPELLSLMYGKAYCVELYVSAIIILLSGAMSVIVIPILYEHKKLYRYFLGKIAPETPEPLRGRGTKAEREENKRLIGESDALSLGEEFEKTVAIYYDCFPDEEKDAIKNLKTDAACVKYRRLKNLEYKILCYERACL